jgi:hypothetical protein
LPFARTKARHYEMRCVMQMCGTANHNATAVTRDRARGFTGPRLVIGLLLCRVRGHRPVSPVSGELPYLMSRSSSVDSTGNSLEGPIESIGGRLLAGELNSLWQAWSHVSGHPFHMRRWVRKALRITRIWNQHELERRVRGIDNLPFFWIVCNNAGPAAARSISRKAQPTRGSRSFTCSSAKTQTGNRKDPVPNQRSRGAVTIDWLIEEPNGRLTLLTGVCPVDRSSLTP